MARYPTYDEYAKNGKFAEGIARCDQLLSKNPHDVNLLITKLQLICTSQPSSPDGPRILDQLITTQPAIEDLNDIVSIELAVADTFKNAYPQPVTLGRTVAKLWENAFKANGNITYRSELLTVRYQRAIYDNRIQDVQQTLIQLKQFQPRNRAIYLAHAAYTQLLSKESGDLQSKLALGLARKAVSEKFDSDPSLDCRVAGQIFAAQSSAKDLEEIRERPAFRESTQVYEALRLHRESEAPSQVKLKSHTEKQNSREWLEQTSEALKSQFKQLVDAAVSVQALSAFVVDAVKLFYAATTVLVLGPRKRSAADPCFLAISGLVRLFSLSGNQTYLLQSIFLAERLLTFEPHVHEARLVLVYLYMKLGLGGEAMRHFDSLSIKEVQFDTVGHTLFTRLSTTHPFRTLLPTGDFFEPHERTNKALQVPPRHENKLFEAEAAVLEHYQTGMIFELNRLREDIRHSLMRRITLLEHRRIARLSGKGYGKGTSDIGPRVIAAWTDVKDNRDFNAAFNFGYNLEKALYSTSPSNDVEAFPKTTWLIYNLAVDQAWSLASKQIPLISDSITDHLLAALQSDLPKSGLTHAETLSAYLMSDLLAVIDSIKAGQAPTSESTQSLKTQLERLHVSALCATKDPLATSLHAHYVYMDTLLIILQTCKLAKETPSLLTPELSKVRDVAMGHIRELQQHAVEVASLLSNKSGSAGPSLEDLATNADAAKAIQDAVQAFGTEAQNALATKLRESAKEGWMGIGQIGLPAGS